MLPFMCIWMMFEKHLKRYSTWVSASSWYAEWRGDTWIASHQMFTSAFIRLFGWSLFIQQAMKFIPLLQTRKKIKHTQFQFPGILLPHMIEYHEVSKTDFFAQKRGTSWNFWSDFIFWPITIHYSVMHKREQWIQI